MRVEMGLQLVNYEVVGKLFRFCIEYRGDIESFFVFQGIFVFKMDFICVDFYL